MSLARLGCDGSDVYVWESMDGRYVCQRPGHRFDGDAGAMLVHLLLHRHEGGEHVPDRVFQRLMFTTT